MPVRILLDQNAPIGLRRALAAHEVSTAVYMGWAVIENGALIQAAEEAGFAILITCDRNIRYQQNLRGRRLALIELPTNHWSIIRQHISELEAAIAAAKPGGYVTVTFSRKPIR